MKKLILLFFLISVCAFGQECPIAYMKMNSHSIDSTKPYKNDAFLVVWKNTGDKTITGVKFQAIFVDSVGDRTMSYDRYIDNHKVKVGKTSSNVWDDGFEMRKTNYGRGQVYPVKVYFEDGTTWENPDQECMSAIK